MDATTSVAAFPLRSLFLLALGAGLSPAQVCPPPACNGTVLCDHHNFLHNAGGATLALTQGPNASTGNLPGDAEWRIFDCEHATTRASGFSTITGFQLRAMNQTSNNPAFGTALFQLPEIEIRGVTTNGTGQRIPDLGSPPSFSPVLGPINLSPGMWNVSIVLAPYLSSTSPWGPPGCGPSPGLPVVPAQDFAVVLLYPPGEVFPPPLYSVYFVNEISTSEANFALNTSAGGSPNSYSGQIDAYFSPPMIAVRPPNEELRVSVAFYEPVLEALKSGPGFPLTPGSGARNLLPFENLVLWSSDWAAGERAFLGQDRLAVFIFGDSTVGSPLCPGGALFPAGGFLPGSPGAVSLHPTPLTFAALPWSLSFGQGMLCHLWSGGCNPSGTPALWSAMRAETAPIAVPPGIPAGTTAYSAAFYLNLTTLVVEDGSNTVELVFL